MPVMKKSKNKTASTTTTSEMRKKRRSIKPLFTNYLTNKTSDLNKNFINENSTLILLNKNSTSDEGPLPIDYSRLLNVKFQVS